MSPYKAVKLLCTVKLFIGIIMMSVGFVLAKGIYVPIGVILASVGTILAARNFTVLVRVVAAEQALRGSPRARQRQQYEQVTLPHKIFLLLFAVAEADGHAEASERDLVQRFLLVRFPKPALAAEIKSWQAELLSQDQLRSLARELQAMLHAGECETVFTWCCFVALIDQKFSDVEHDVLQLIASEFSIPKHHARRLFLHAKNRILNEQRQNDHSWSNQGGRGSSGDGGRRRNYTGGPRASSLSPRRRALDALGLEEGASADDIRKRHRELAKKYHPDAHSHLGPVAAEEATDRFREIQEAYELLRS